jgi:putative peptidoglycan binding protein
MDYRRGAKGEEVSRIQTRLRELGLYRGPIDGDFGGGTESAAREFQLAQGLEADGIVGPTTWQALYGGAGPIPAPAIAAKPLIYRNLALTGAFETEAPIPECFAVLAGDFDGQGMSFGALQWNLGQGTLQPLLSAIDRAHPEVIDNVFGPHAGELRAMLSSSREDQLSWARSIQDGRRSIIAEPWRGLFKTLGRREEFQDIEVGAARQIYQDAVTWCGAYGVKSERAVALMFDIRVQNGSIASTTRAQIQRDFATLEAGVDADTFEVARLRVIANRRAEAANPRWVEDVRARKLTIANGKGAIHGAYYDLEGQYGISLRDVIVGVAPILAGLDSPS